MQYYIIYIQCVYIKQLNAWSQNQTSPGFHTQIVGIIVHELLAFDFRNWKEKRGLTSLATRIPAKLAATWSNTQDNEIMTSHSK